jgi:putative acetyltransferase
MIEIKPIQPHQTEAVKRVILTVCQEIFEVSEEVILKHDNLSDIDQVRSHYFNSRGVFLVLLDDETVVGCGAIHYLSKDMSSDTNGDICELKRMWFLKAYRGLGWGTKMSYMLFDFAKQNGYTKVRLDTTDEYKQAPAIKLYQRLGFYLIKRYNDSACTVFLEKML